MFFIAFSYGQENKKTPSQEKDKIVRKNDAINEFSNQLNQARAFQPTGLIRCASTEHNRSLQKSNLAPSDEEFEKWLAPKVAEIRNKRNQRALPTTIVIPVVIHIVHNGDAVGSGENISLAQALSQIRVFNEDFGKLAGTPGDGAGVDTGIQFCLAQVDPNGNPTSGVVRHNLGIAAFGSAQVETAKASTIWDPTKYLNMWTFNFGGDLAGVLGYAQFPTGSGLPGMPSGECYDDSGSGASTDGVVCAYTTWGSSSYSTGAFGAPYDKGRTMTHEVGHMFGLRHIWGDDACPASGGNVYTNEDFCADTPAAAGPNGGCPAGTNSCTAIAGNDMIENYMDYTNDTCMSIFTQDQKDRMLAVLMNSPRRDDLLVSTVCSAVVTPNIQFKRQDCDFRPVNSVPEGSNCAGYTEFTIVLDTDKAPSANAVVTFAIDGTSTANAADVQIMTPTVTFPAGSTADQNLVLRVLHDGVVELDENLVISFTINANGGDAVANPNGKTFDLKILNDDSAPILVQNYNAIDEDCSDLSDWQNLDADGDTKKWGTWTGLQGFGTTPNTLTNTWAFSEKKIGYFGGTVSTANPNNYLISKQIKLPVGATSISLSYIVGAYDDGGPARNAGNFSVYFTTSIANEAAILAGTLIQANLVINDGTTQLITHNLMTTPNLMGQTGYLVFRHNNTSTTNIGLLILDSVKIAVLKNTLVQTEINTPTRYDASLNYSGSIYGYDDITDNVIGSITNNTSTNYGCTSIEVNRSQTSVGAGSASFIDTNAANRIMPKTYYVTTASDTATGNYSITLYCTAAEVAAWEAATGKSRTALQIIKVINNPISTINASNYTNYLIEEKPATIGAFGTGVTFTATFNTNMTGGYAIGPKTGIVCGDLTSTWNGTAWSNGAPSKVTAVTFTGNYSSTADLDACSATINTGVNVTFNAGHTFVVGNAVTANGTGTLTINNNAALRQVNAVVNTGSSIVKRNSAGMVKLDYTAWSSPVSGQQLQAFSPSTLSNRFYEYLYTGTTTPTAYQSVTATTNFVAGKGYMIRAADNWPLTSTVFNGQFTGVLTNGNVSQSIGIGYNLLGNPYASPISANTFLSANASIPTLYFWTHTVPASGGIYPVNNYASYTTLGGTASAAGGAVPNGTIQTGQGFFVRTTAAGNANFTNAQRVNASVSTQFYRTAESVATTTETEKHRIWLNLNDASNNYNQILLGYMDGATNGVDHAIDGEVLDKDNTMLYNVINDSEYVIQGKGLPFADTDEIALGLKANTAGTYSISLENVDGLFTTQNVYVKDNVTNTIHDIKQTPYAFTTSNGVFNNRFTVVFTNAALGNQSFVSDENVVVFTQNEELKINASQEISKVEVFDVLGRNVYKNNNVNDTALNITSIANRNQALLVKITFTTGQSVTKKVIK